MNFSVLRRTLVSAATVWALASGFVTDGNDYWADWAQIPTMIKLVSLLGLGFVSNQLKVMIPNIFDTKPGASKPATASSTKMNKVNAFFNKMGTAVKGLLWTGIPASIAYYFTRGQADSYLLAGPAGALGLLSYLGLRSQSTKSVAKTNVNRMPAYVAIANFVDNIRGREGYEKAVDGATIQVSYITQNGNRRTMDIRPSDNQFSV